MLSKARKRGEGGNGRGPARHAFACARARTPACPPARPPFFPCWAVLSDSKGLHGPRSAASWLACCCRRRCCCSFAPVVHCSFVFVRRSGLALVCVPSCMSVVAVAYPRCPPAFFLLRPSSLSCSRRSRCPPLPRSSCVAVLVCASRPVPLAVFFGGFGVQLRRQRFGLGLVFRYFSTYSGQPFFSSLILCFSSSSFGATRGDGGSCRSRAAFLFEQKQKLQQQPCADCRVCVLQCATAILLPCARRSAERCCRVDRGFGLFCWPSVSVLCLFVCFPVCAATPPSSIAGFFFQ